MVIFRDYQLDCISAIETHFKHDNRQLIQMPTGAGKTFIFLEYLRRNSKKALIIVPTIDILEQVEDSSLHFFHKSQVYAKKEGRHKDADIIIVTAASLNYKSTKNWLCNTPFDTIVIDEAHRAHTKTYTSFLNLYGDKVKLLGLTATPERLDRKCLLDIFETLTFEMSVVDLIEKGSLCDIKATRHSTGQKLPSYISKGDFRAIELRALDNPSRNAVIKKIINENCRDKQTIVFCLTIDHAESLAKDIRNMGITCEAVHSKLSKHERRRRIHLYRESFIQIVTNVQALTEGFDAPCTKALVIARPTRSKALYCQMIGRGLRNFPQKECCYLYELTDNNHKICTFNVAAGAEPDNIREYLPGTKLTKWARDPKIIDFDAIETVIEKIDVYEKKTSFITNHEALPHQIDQLEQLNIPYHQPLTLQEAMFLLWLHKTKVQYGYI